VLPILEAQLRHFAPSELDARFVRRVPGLDPIGLSERERTLFDRITGVHSVAQVLKYRIETQSLRRLQDRGFVQVSGLTPTDAAHVLGYLDAWDAEAADMALRSFARRRVGSGEMLAQTAPDLAQMIVDQLTHQTSSALLETAFAEESGNFQGSPEILARHELIKKGLSNHAGILRIDAGLNIPVVGLGASAEAYYPAVGAMVGCEMILPEHAGVANAVGAVVGRITMRKTGTVTSPSEGIYRVHGANGPEDFNDPQVAIQRLEDALRSSAEADAHASGARELQISVARELKESPVDGRDVFIEAILTVEASGRPRIAHDG